MSRVISWTVKAKGFEIDFIASNSHTCYFMVSSSWSQGELRNSFCTILMGRILMVVSCWSWLLVYQSEKHMVPKF
jgi:hypothetical protein